MTNRYVGPGGSDANNGLSWVTRKLTLNGVEDTPVVAGDVVYVGAGTYREMLTVDVSGTAGNPITYIGDYLGTNTNGVGGVVRITGSDNDQTATRTRCITSVSKNYRTFQGFQFDTTTADIIFHDGGTNWVIQNCVFQASGSGNDSIEIAGASQASNIIQNCVFLANTQSNTGIRFTHSSTVDNSAQTVQNCIFIGMIGVGSVRVGGLTVKNSIFLSSAQAVRVLTAITVGQTVTVNNCIFQACTTAFQGTVSGEIVENYNTLYANGTDRTNTATGANSVAYPALFDPRWFFQLVTAGAGPNNATQLVSPFDLSSFSQLVNVAGTSPPTTDMRGTAVQGSQREWGALEYDSTLKIQGGAAGAHSIFGGEIVR
jgi:hypothetical protein